MKTKYNKVNTCAACREKASNFIWASSRQVNKGIKVMYPKEKLCLKCYENMKTVYPEQPLTGHHQKCSCGGRIVECAKGVGEHHVERYCETCGLVIEDKDAEFLSTLVRMARGSNAYFGATLKRKEWNKKEE